MNNLKPLVNNKDLWESLVAELNERLECTQRQVELRVEPEEIYRLQGEARALRSLTRLRDKVNG